MVTFLAAVPEDQRHELLKNISQLLRLENFDAVRFCANETEQMSWKKLGLPADSLSIENAVAMTRTTQTSLSMDPSGRVSSFLQKLFPNAVLLRANQDDVYTQV